MNKLREIRFWHLMVGTGFTLLAIGLVLIFLPPGVGDSEPFLIDFFEASMEGSEMGLALIVLGLSCFLIGRKDLADLRTYRGVQENLDKTSALTAKLVAGRVARTFNNLPDKPTNLRTLPGLDVEGTINGESATGTGQILTGDSGNATSDGLSLLIELVQSEVIAGPEGVITLVDGIGARVADRLEALTDPVDGRLVNRTNTLNRKIDELEDDITRMGKLLEDKRSSLLADFARLEASLAVLNAQGDFLLAQLESLRNVNYS